MRNHKRVLIAEDDEEILKELAITISKVRACDYWAVKRVSDIMPALEESNAFWAILDLELEDGNTIDVIKEIKDKYGNEVRVIVCTGYYEQYTELAVFTAGAMDMFKKPINPMALIKKMDIVEDMLKGTEAKPAVEKQSTILLLGENAFFDIKTDYCKVNGDRKFLMENIKNVLKVLASGYQPDGTWEWLTRAQILLACEGVESTPPRVDDEVENLNLAAKQSQKIDNLGEKLRKYTQKIREVFGDVIEVQRTGDNSSVYRFKKQVKFLTEQESSISGMKGADNA